MAIKHAHDNISENAIIDIGNAMTDIYCRHASPIEDFAALFYKMVTR